jgi:K+ transporter
VFLVNIPVGLAVIAVALRFVPESRVVGAARAFDVTGAVTVTGGLLLLVYAIVKAEQAGWASLQTLGLGAVALALLAASSCGSRARRRRSYAWRSSGSGRSRPPTP